MRVSVHQQGGFARLDPQVGANRDVAKVGDDKAQGLDIPLQTGRNVHDSRGTIRFLV
jgi:hypothetical protein